jgi:hypothetical protein
LVIHLGAALFATKFKNIKIKTYEYGGDSYFVEILDIQIFVQYLILKVLGSEYYSKNRQPQIKNLLRFYNLSSYLVENEDLFNTIISILYPFEGNSAAGLNYSTAYETKYTKLKQLLLQYVIDQTTEHQNTELSISDVEEYLNSKYPELIYRINNDIFQNNNLTEDDKKSKVFEIITQLSSNLISYSVNITDINDKIVYQDNVIKFAQLFINIKPENNVMSTYISDRIDVILTQIPVYVIPFIDYSQMLYVIKDFLQMLPMKDKVNIVLGNIKPLSFILYRRE